MSGIMNMLLGANAGIAYATWDPAFLGTGQALSNGNKTVTASSGWGSTRSTLGKSTGLWFIEYTIGSSAAHFAGICNASAGANTFAGDDADGYAIQVNTGDIYNASTIQFSTGATWAVGDRVGLALNAGTGHIGWYKNGTIQTSATSGLTGPYYFIVSQIAAGSNAVGNFGPTFVSVPGGYNVGLY